jgi:hypothetical protein
MRVPLLVNPLSDVRGAVPQPGSERLTQCQEEDGIPVDEFHLRQVKHDSMRRQFRSQQSQELGNLRRLYPANESEYRLFAFNRSVNFQGHRMQPSALEDCTRCANRISLK